MGIKFLDTQETPPASAGNIRFIEEPPAPITAESPSNLTSFGRTAASLADVTLGGVLPAAVQAVAYPLARIGRTPEEAQTAAQNLAASVDKPFGKAFGVTQSPEYQKEAARQLIDFIGSNVQKGYKWIAEKTGIPEQDIESYINSGLIAAPTVAKPAISVVAPVVGKAIKTAKTTALMSFEQQLKARQQRLSSEDYARGPQIEAAQEAQRLGIALKPSDIQPTAGKKLITHLAGEEGVRSIQSANINKIRQIALNEMDLPPDTQLNSTEAFNNARLKVAAPYNEIRKLPTMVADNNVLDSLNKLRPDETLIGSNNYTKATNAIIDDAISKVTEGLTGEQLLKNVQTLRKRATKTFNNKSADLAALDAADTNLAIASTLESMVESNVFDPKLLGRFREARAKMARTYAYEGATDLNTGMLDVSRLSKITSKDNTLTGDISALGQISGNFPDAFTNKATNKAITKQDKLGRTGFAGSLGGLTGYAMGGDYVSAALGSVAGAGLGEMANMLAARRISSPEYQAGLTVRDKRIPVAAAEPQGLFPIPQERAIVPYQAPVEVLGKNEGPYRPNFTIPQGTLKEPPTLMSSLIRELPAPSAESTLGSLRNEDIRRSTMSRELGKQAETQQAAAEAQTRKTTSGEVILEFDPVTGRFKEASQGVKGATPETFSNFGASLQSAASKVTQGKLFDLTATEKVAWDKTKIDLAEAVPGFKSLSDKALSEKMMDRKWVEDTVVKAREKAMMFEQAAARAKSMREVEVARANRERMLDLVADLEDVLSRARPDNSRKIQGTKTRTAFREGLFSSKQQNQ